MSDISFLMTEFADLFLVKTEMKLRDTISSKNVVSHLFLNVSRARGALEEGERWESTDSWVEKSWRSVIDNQGNIH